MVQDAVMVGLLLPPQEQLSSNAIQSGSALPIESPTKTQLLKSLALATENALEEPSSLQPDLQQAVQLAVKRTESAKSYSSHRIVTDASTGDSVEWRLDFVKPDKLHIARMVKDTTDEWVKIGLVRFYSAPPSFSTSSSEWETAEEALLVETALDTLRRLTPIHP